MKPRNFLQNSLGALALLLLLAGTTLSAAAPAYPLKPAYKGNDGSAYYVRQIGSNVYWFGEKADGGFANIFYGTRSGNQVTGYWADVPKGATHGNGKLSFKIASDSSLRRVSATGGFGESLWLPNDAPADPPHKRAAFYSSTTMDNLDGAWACNDSGTYYINQVGSSVYWFGEQDVTSGRPNWANIAYGKRVGNTVSLKWVDVPKGTLSSGNGDITINVASATDMYRLNVTGGFGGSKWTREKATTVFMQKTYYPEPGTIEQPGPQLQSMPAPKPEPGTIVQPGPQLQSMPAPSYDPSLILHTLDGEWKNTNPSTINNTRFVISGNNTLVRVFGKCSPTDCDWGNTSLTKANTNKYKAFYDMAHSHYDMEFELLANGEMRVTYRASYKDGRPVRTVTETFKKP
jgi:hypothetical protein